jgi:GNAT superfamily N-acetyltransferase
MHNTSPVRIGFIQARPSSKTLSPTDDSPITLSVGQANASDTSKVIDVIADAFTHDPTWSWAFPDPAARRVFWGLSIAGAIRYPWVYKTKGFEAVSVWIPPDESEFTLQDEEQLPSLLKELVGRRAAEVEELLRRFGESHPRNEPHYYLSLLGTRTEHRGQGLGMALLQENLARIDAEHMPAYLESSNPGNNQAYESVGFASIVSFQAPNNGPIVTGMWRKVPH